MFRSIITQVLPDSLLYLGYILKQRYTYRDYLGTTFYCPICNTGLNNFIPLAEIGDGIFMRDITVKGKTHSIYNYETLNTAQFLCPICGSQDKARLYALFISKFFSKLDKKLSHKLSFLHFAPEGGLPQLIKKYPFLCYRTADLLRDDVDEKADLTHLQHQANSVTYFIASHILEHIPDDTKALSELYRVLKKGGWGILTVPILTSLVTTYEDASITTEAGRLLHFGQADHVRVYAKNDFVSKLQAAGFTVHQLTQAQLSESDFEVFGIAPTSVLYVVTK